MGNNTVLLTGGAGYIGSHVALDLVGKGYEVIVLDDLSRGFAAAVRVCELVRGDAGDRKLVCALLTERRVASVLHFAASTVVPESVGKPLLYYENNTVKSRNLLEACVDCGVRQFVFSSTAAVYGVPESGQATLATPHRTRESLRDVQTHDRDHAQGRLCGGAVALCGLGAISTWRGADPEGRIGQSTPACTLLVKVACEAAPGETRAIVHLRHGLPDPGRHRVSGTISTSATWPLRTCWPCGAWKPGATP